MGLKPEVVNLPKFMKSPSALIDPTCTVNIRDDELARFVTKKKNTVQSDKNRQEHLVEAVDYKSPKSRENQFDRQNAMKNLYKILNDDFKEKLTIQEKYYAQCTKFISMLRQFQSMLDGDLCLMSSGSTESSLIRLIADLISVPYQSWPHVR